MFYWLRCLRTLTFVNWSAIWSRPSSSLLICAACSSRLSSCKTQTFAGEIQIAFFHYEIVRNSYLTFIITIKGIKMSQFRWKCHLSPLQICEEPFYMFRTSQSSDFKSVRSSILTPDDKNILFNVGWPQSGHINIIDPWNQCWTRWIAYWWKIMFNIYIKWVIIKHETILIFPIMDQNSLRINCSNWKGYLHVLSAFSTQFT